MSGDSQNLKTPATSERRLVVEFTKMTGAGNDFVVVDNRFFFFTPDELAGFARLWCDRRNGIGGDGLLALEPAPDASHHFRMRYINADGSFGTMCGNGARCLARYARSAGMTANPLVFLTDAGTFSAQVPASTSEDVLLELPGYSGAHRSEADERGPERWFAWTGTEHVVVFVDNVSEADVAGMGPRLRQPDPGTHEGTNVNFVEVVGEATVRVRTWEKGVEAETLACGTGATASALVACMTGRVRSDRVSVEMPGGVLTVGVEGGQARWLAGPARTVFRGTLEV
jgi:diaminopimelate epimerase